MDESVKKWLSSSEGKSVLNKFTPSEVRGVENILAISGIKARTLLDDYESALSLAKNPRMLELLEKQGGVTHDSMQVLATIDGATAQLWSNEELQDANLALQRLRSWKLSQHDQDPRVTPTLERLRTELAFYEPQFSKRAVIGQLEGSFYFGDPSENPDIDLYFYVVDDEDEHPDLVKLSSELPEYMEMKMDISICNLTDVEKFLDEFTTESVSLDNDSNFLDSASLLCSEHMRLPGADHKKVERKIKELKKKILQLAAKNPVFRTILIGYLINMEKPRRKKTRNFRKQI